MAGLLLIPAPERQRQEDLCEFKASLVYVVSSRIQGYYIDKLCLGEGEGEKKMEERKRKEGRGREQEMKMMMILSKPIAMRLHLQLLKKSLILR